MSPLDNPDESMLIRRAHIGDDEAWSSLVLRHGGMLRRLASLRLDSRLRTHIGPDDVVQEAVFDAFRSLGKFFETSLPFTIWLRQRLTDRLDRIHRDHLMSQKRGTRRGVGIDTDWGFHPMDPGTSPSGPTRRVEEAHLLQKVIGQLAEGDRELILLVFFEEYAYGDVAAILGIEPATMRQRLCRAVARIEVILRRTHPEWCHAIEFAC